MIKRALQQPVLRAPLAIPEGEPRGLLQNSSFCNRPFCIPKFHPWFLGIKKGRSKRYIACSDEKYQIEAQRSGFDLERRSSGVSALWLLQKSRSKRYIACSDDVERIMGIEPTSTAWEAVVLPMNYIRKSYYTVLVYFTKPAVKSQAGKKHS